MQLYVKYPISIVLHTVAVGGPAQLCIVVASIFFKFSHNEVMNTTFKPSSLCNQYIVKHATVPKMHKHSCLVTVWPLFFVIPPDFQEQYHGPCSFPEVPMLYMPIFSANRDK